MKFHFLHSNASFRRWVIKINSKTRRKFLSIAFRFFCPAVQLIYSILIFNCLCIPLPIANRFGILGFLYKSYFSSHSQLNHYKHPGHPKMSIIQISALKQMKHFFFFMFSKIKWVASFVFGEWGRGRECKKGKTFGYRIQFFYLYAKYFDDWLKNHQCVSTSSLRKQKGTEKHKNVNAKWKKKLWGRF